MNDMKILKESTQSPEKTTGNRWRVVIATPGQGSSGFYSEDVIREQGPLAMAPGAQSYINHDDKRDPKEMIGTFPDGAYWDESRKALMGELEVFPHWKEFVENVGPHCGMSIYMHGESDEDGNVTKLIPNPYNGCDLVARPGLAGAGFDEKLYEAAMAHTENQTKEDEMTIEELAAEIQKLQDSLSALVDVQESKSRVEAEAETVEEAVATALESYDAVLEAIESADLLPSQAADLRARARAGEDITDAIEAAKKVKAEADELAKESGSPKGKTLNEGATVQYGAWK